MKNLLINLMVLVMSVSLLASCSTNTRSQNTGIGAVTGAVAGGVAGSLVGGGTAVAVGAVAGGLIGGFIGHSMDSSDNTMMTHAMTNNPPHKTTHWRNKKTHTSYNITPTSKVMSYNGNSTCRTYTATAITSNGKRHVSHGIACQQTDGSWQTVTRS